VHVGKSRVQGAHGTDGVFRDSKVDKENAENKEQTNQLTSKITGRYRTQIAAVCMCGNEEGRLKEAANPANT